MTKLGMLRSGKKSKTLIVVEGVTDYRVYGKIFDLTTCEIVIGESKENVVEAIKMCEAQQLEGVIGIVDADFWHLKTQRPAVLPKTLFITDYHDLECMMLHSRAFEHVFLEYGDLGKLARFERLVEEKLPIWMLKNVAQIGYLRKLSLERNLELGFSQLTLEKFMDMNKLEVIKERMIQEILFASHKQGSYKVWQINQWLGQEKSQDEDLWQVCCGHDLMEWLSLGFALIFGNYNAKKLFSGQLEGSFRLTYHRALFEETILYNALKKWEYDHPTYQLFSKNDMNQVI